MTGIAINPALNFIWNVGVQGFVVGVQTGMVRYPQTAEAFDSIGTAIDVYQTIGKQKDESLAELRREIGSMSRWIGCYTPGYEDKILSLLTENSRAVDRAVHMAISAHYSAQAAYSSAESVIFARQNSLFEEYSKISIKFINRHQPKESRTPISLAEMFRRSQADHSYLIEKNRQSTEETKPLKEKGSVDFREAVDQIVSATFPSKSSRGFVDLRRAADRMISELPETFPSKPSADAFIPQFKIFKNKPK